ncbi:unnamed protein product [Fraxinus pennsylvanica]|uniref:Probable ubiquitin-like-specific protease 2A/B PH domain-containing protein n=1 Tax=Fraxinus pennsylvanica TaxID=56036 RepID=A0AAD1Z742_9LAMI|nr:unnamed protein product [Fraxinus pennsylvanica]
MIMETNRYSSMLMTILQIKVLDVDSDDDQRIGLVSSSSVALIDNEGSLEEPPFEYGVDTSDIALICIKLGGSPAGKRKGPCCQEWPISNIVDIEHEWCESVMAVVKFNLISDEENTAEISNKTAGIVPLEFVVSNGTYWSEKLEAIKSLDMRYKTHWSTVVSGYSSNKPFEDLIYPDGDPDAISICSRDIELLQPKTFINDTIIDFYIKYLANKTNPEESHDKGNATAADEADVAS